MKKYILFTFVFIISQTLIKAQNFSREYGVIGKAEIELKQYEPDKTAEAVVLFDIGKSHFIIVDGSFEIVYERSTRIKIFSEAGVKWADIEIPFYREGSIFERVTDITAMTYNYENGNLKKSEFNSANIYEEKINDSWSVKKITMPDVKPGSIIEYKYQVQTQFKFNLADWNFQWKIPVVYSEYEVKMIPFYEYVWLFQGASKFDTQISEKEKGLSSRFGGIEYNDMIHKYIMKDIPAFNNEEFITSINDYIMKIDFQLSKINYTNGASAAIMTTWPNLIKEFEKHENFGKYIKKSEKLASGVLDLDALIEKPENDKFNDILNFVKQNYSWNKIDGKYASKSANDFLKDKYGNSADINLFTIGLLNAAGIDAYPVLISTRDHGKIKGTHPFSHLFNYVLILSNIDGKNIITDATQIYYSNYRIPPRCINDYGLIIDREQENWVNLQFKSPSYLQTDLSIIIGESDINAKIQATATEYYASYFRSNYGKDIEKIVKNLKEDNENPIDSTIVVKNQDNIDLPYILKYDLSTAKELINDKIYISPFLNFPISNNPLNQKTRTYPIDMTYPTQKLYNSTIQIPKGFKVDYLPENVKIGNELFELEYTLTNTDNEIKVSFNYYFKNSVYEANDYDKIKFYFKEIIKKGNEKIVLSRN